MTLVRIVIAIGVLACAARPADACYPAFNRAIVGAPVFEPAGDVTVTKETVDVHCTETFTCEVDSTFDIVVAQPARATVTAYHASSLSLRIPGRTTIANPADPASVTAELAPTTTQLVVHAIVDVVPFVDGCFTDGVIARHPYLASSRTSNEHVLQIDTRATPHVIAPSSWTMLVDKRDDKTTRLWFEAPERRFTHGGPLLVIGAHSGEGRTFRMRGGWEAAIGAPWLVVGLTGETDFANTWNVALTAEPTTRAWVLPLSLGAGAGVVLANDRRIGGRAQLSIALGPARFILSLDAIRGGDLGVAALIGGSL